MKALLLLALLIGVSAMLHELSRSRETLVAKGLNLRVIDGDSFELGSKRLRLDGMDAPEYHQSCQDANGAEWECGKAARANLEKLLRQPGLVCEHEIADRYGRALATCRTSATPDIAAAQVKEGFAVTHEFAGIRDYPDEQDAASEAKRGIWQGSFMRPEEWRVRPSR